MKKKSIMSNVSERDKKLLLVLGAILVLALAYFVFFKGNMDKAEEYATKNEDIRSYIRELDMKILNEEVKKAEIVQYNASRSEILNHYTKDMTHEKAVDVISTMERETGLVPSNITFAVNELFFSQEEEENNNVIPLETITNYSSSIVVPGVSEQEYDKLTGYKTTATIEFSCEGEQLEKVIDFINDHEDKMCAESLTVGYDDTAASLSGTLVLCMYAVDGAEREYEAPEIAGVSSGVADIFGTKKSTKPSKKK